MRFAYADPPYFGLAAKFYADRHERAAEYDDISAHRRLIERLCDEFADGWALSMTSSNLHDILPLCPRSARLGAWVKPWRGFPGAKPARFIWWVLEILNAQRDDDIVDLFYGSGAVQRAVDEWRDGCAGLQQSPLFAPISTIPEQEPPP